MGQQCTVHIGYLFNQAPYLYGPSTACLLYALTNTNSDWKRLALFESESVVASGGDTFRPGDDESVFDVEEVTSERKVSGKR